MERRQYSNIAMNSCFTNTLTYLKSQSLTTRKGELHLRGGTESATMKNLIR